MKCQENFSILKLIKRRMEELKLRPIDLSRKAGVSPPVISRLLNDGAQISLNNVTQLLLALGLLNLPEGDANPYDQITDFSTVPWLHDTPSCGNDGLAVVKSLDSEQHIAFRRDWIDRKYGAKNCRAFKVQGESMFPVVQDGDVVLVDISKNKWEDIKDGKIYVFSEVDTLKLKRLIKREAQELIERSDNRDLFPERKIDLETFKLIGKVVWVGHEIM